MKKITILALIVVLFLVVMGVGLFSVLGLGFLAASNNYAGNGVSFEYPADYKIIEIKNNSMFLTASNTKNPSLTFQVSKAPVNGSLYHGTSLDKYYNALLNDFKSRGWLTMSDNTTMYVDGTHKEVQTYSIDYMEKVPSDPDSVNGRIMMFDKNGIRYTIVSQGKGKQHYDSWADIKVTTSFKVYK